METTHPPIKEMKNMAFDSFLRKKKQEKKKRTPVPLSLEREIRRRSQGRCERCHELIPAGVKDELHHKDGDPTNHTKSNIILLCPNCHSTKRIHTKKLKKKEPENTGPFGNLFRKSPYF
jgi:5-methylcytosine-specific restriction endonuclease McrA